MAIIEPEFMELTRSLDVAAWWEENDRCQTLSPDKPRCPASFSPDDHWIFEFMAVPSTLRYYQDTDYRNALHREVNAITREYVGRAFFDEDTWRTSPKRIENLFGSEFGYHEGSTPWLMPVTDDPDEFARVLDRAEATDLRTWALPEDYLAEWEARKAAGRPLPKLGTGSRGPATIMTSILKPEVLFLWFYDYPDLMRRFRDILAAKMVEFNTILREFSGNTEPGWWITDDNCALFNRKLYREYCYPVLEKVLAAMAPGDARRYQHSDSAMGHLMEMQTGAGHQFRQLWPDRGRRPDPGEDARRRDQRPTAALPAARRQPGGDPPAGRRGLPESWRERSAERHHRGVARRRHRRGPDALVHAGGAGGMRYDR